MRVWRSRPTWMKHLTSSEAACERRWQMLGEWPVSLPRGCSTQGAQQRCHTGACFFVRFLLPSSYLSHACVLLALHFVTQRLCSRTSRSSFYSTTSLAMQMSCRRSQRCPRASPGWVTTFRWRRFEWLSTRRLPHTKPNSSKPRVNGTLGWSATRPTCYSTAISN